jgi:Response regulator containing a CheY-like receiver domain and an HTH DNA-binding domain
MPIKIKIIIVDDHSMVAAGLSSELSQQPDFEVIKTLNSPENLIECIDRSNPDVILMDIRMGLYNGIAVTEEVKEVYPETKVVLMSGYNMGQLAKDSKADAFTSKEEPISSLSDTIRKVCLEQALIFPNDNLQENKLTKTEMKILELLGNDLTRKEIAAAMFVSEKTVANHITSVLLKLNVRSRVGAVIKGIELGLVDSSNMI